MKILVTGAKGMLGREVVKAFSRQHQVTATDLPELDITDASRLTATLQQHRPELLLHLAAMTDVDGCETNPSAAFRVNAEATRHLARTCRALQSNLLYLSTSDIFDGAKSVPYTEEDQPRPVNQYGKSKYQGELYVRELMPEAYIIRTCWLFGGGADDRKFVAQIIQQARAKSNLAVIKDVHGSPTYTRDLAEGILKITEKGKPGTYHLVNRGRCSRYELARKVLEYAGIKDCRIQGVWSHDYPTIAPRPRMAALDSLNLNKIDLANLMRPWPEALAEYVRSFP